MKIVGQRLRALRESVKMSQAKIGALFGCKQSSINRYESGEASAPYEVLLQYADHFDAVVAGSSTRSGADHPTPSCAG